MDTKEQIKKQYEKEFEPMKRGVYHYTRWLEEMLLRTQAESDLTVPVVVVNDCDYGHKILNNKNKPCKLMCCVKKEEWNENV